MWRRPLYMPRARLLLAIAARSLSPGLIPRNIAAQAGTLAQAAARLFQARTTTLSSIGVVMAYRGVTRSARASAW
jgi:hypothetical protein